MRDLINEDWVRAELSCVFFAGDGELRLGKFNIERIVLVTDGMGLTGRYDRIHVIFKDSRRKHQVFPAHKCAGFEYLTPEDEN